MKTYTDGYKRGLEYAIQELRDMESVEVDQNAFLLLQAAANYLQGELEDLPDVLTLVADGELECPQCGSKDTTALEGGLSCKTCHTWAVVTTEDEVEE